MDKNIKNAFRIGGDPLRFLFKNGALLLFYPYGALTSCKKSEKTNGRSLRYLKTDRRTRAINKDPPRVNSGSKMKNSNIYYQHFRSYSSA